LPIQLPVVAVAPVRYPCGRIRCCNKVRRRGDVAYLAHLLRGGVGLDSGRSAALAEAVHVNVNDRRRKIKLAVAIPRAANDWIAERLVGFGANAGAEHQWDAAKQGARRRH
jgi:hypothetical protein